MINNLINPPQGGNYRELPGDLFPEQYPFDFKSLFNTQYFWLKYYISQRAFFAIPKRPMYVNYEILCNAMATNVIDLSEAEIYQVKNSEMTEA